MTKMPLRQGGGAIAAALLSAALILTACGSPAQQPTAGTSSQAAATRTIKADYGHTVEVPAAPQRVAVLHPAYVAMYLDLGGKPVAVSALTGDPLAELTTDQRAAYDAATDVSSSAGEDDLEKLASLKPDVILYLTNEAGWTEIKEKLTSIAPTVPVDVMSKSDFQFTVLAEATNTVDVLNDQKAKFKTRVAEIQQKHAEVLKTAKIVEAYRSTWSEPGKFAINASMCAEVVLDEKVVEFAPTEYDLSFEKISSLAKYDLILYLGTLDGKPTDASAALLKENAWKALSAVKSGHAQPVYCGTWKTYGFMMQYLDGLDKALATLPKK